MKPKQNNKTIYIFIGASLYLFVILFSLHVGKYMHLHPTEDLFSALFNGLNSLTSNPFNFLPIAFESFKILGIATLLVAFMVFAIVVSNEKNKASMPGKESGTAKWNTDFNAYNKQYTDPKGSTDHHGKNNMILSQNVFLNMNTRDTFLNNNVLVIGGSGSGKSRFFVKPNLLQANCNYVITDPAGELLAATGKFLEDEGYEIRVFNLVEMQKSHCYNPFEYVRDDESVLTMIDCLISNTTPPNTRGGDQFWVKSETALLQALCFYLIHHVKEKEKRNFNTVMQLLRAAEVDENNPNKKSILDNLFEKARQENPDSLAYKQYMTFKMGAGKTLKSILISCAVRLTVFNLQQIANLTNVDTIDLGSMGDGKKALFVITPQGADTYNFLSSMLYSQLFETLYYKGNERLANGGSAASEREVRFLLDEFVNIGQIPRFTQKLATMRKYGISCSVIIQNIAQLKPLYEDWETIVGNCDTMIFLGGQEQSTLEYVSNNLGIQTIKVRNASRSRGKSPSSSFNFNATQRKLMNPDEVARIDKSECIVMIRALYPFLDKKYDYPKHPNYKRTGDANEKYAYINRLNNNQLDGNLAKLRAEHERLRQLRQLNQNNKAFSTELTFAELSSQFSAQHAMDVLKQFKAIETRNVEKKSQSVAKRFLKCAARLANEDEKEIILSTIKQAPEKHDPDSSFSLEEEIAEALMESVPKVLQQAATEWVLPS